MGEKRVKAILDVDPDDFILAGRSAKKVIESNKKSKTKFLWDDITMIEFEDGSLFEVKTNKLSVTVRRLN